MNTGVRVALVLSLLLVASLPASALSCRVCAEFGCVNSQQYTGTRCAPVQNPADCRQFEDYSCTPAPPEFVLFAALSVVSIEIIGPSARITIVSSREEVPELTPAADAAQK
jgi:hypothetical protein